MYKTSLNFHIESNKKWWESRYLSGGRPSAFPFMKIIKKWRERRDFPSTSLNVTTFCVF